MERRALGRSGIEVSVIGLGTMTWGEQNTPSEAFQQMDYAVERGINLFDTAEMYPVPPKASTQGSTESIIGDWFSQRGGRDRVVLATKVVGPGRGFQWIRGGQTRFTKAHIIEACEGSLRRLKTDYIDLYQLHWPDRQTNFFGRRWFRPQEDEQITPLEESLEAMAQLVKQGKVRQVGLSNETPWGVMHALRLSETKGLPRVQVTQNPYNLLNRSFEVGLAEVSMREQVGLLAYSPLAMGVLSGKYRGGRVFPPGSRLARYTRYQRYRTEAAFRASEAYVDVAREFGLDPSQMALAFINRQPFVASNLIGATSMEQLEANIASAEVQLSAEVMERLEEVGERYPDPCP